MFLLRRAKMDDVPSLLKLARTVHFINLPPDKAILDEKVAWSRQCFMLAAEASLGKRTPKRAGDAPAKSAVNHGARPGRVGLSAGIRDVTGRSPLFMFVLEDTEVEGGVVGTSQIVSQMGGPGFPNVSLQLGFKDLFSQSLQMGVRHTVARLHLDETGPTEIGGLILQHSLRGHKQRLGRFLSLARFHFIGLHRRLFSDVVLAELMGPINAEGRSPFWDHCTRHFINLTLEEADRFCQESKEFLLTLFPREDLYLTLLAPEARAVVGQVGAETAPARRMLENIGFRYHHRVDPFDGGPHIEAVTDQIALVKATSVQKAAEPVSAPDDSAMKRFGTVSHMAEDGEFRALQTGYDLDRSGRVVLTAKSLELLQARPGASVGVTPTERPGSKGAATPATSARRGSRPGRSGGRR